MLALKELRKLTIASERPESFFKVRKDTPRGQNMLGSLVVVVPNRHEGEALHQGEKWDFDCAAFIAMSHLTVTSNLKFPMVYHAALTYSLYFDHSTAS